MVPDSKVLSNSWDPLVGLSAHPWLEIARAR